MEGARNGASSWRGLLACLLGSYTPCRGPARAGTQPALPAQPALPPAPRAAQVLEVKQQAELRIAQLNSRIQRLESQNHRLAEEAAAAAQAASAVPPAAAVGGGEGWLLVGQSGGA